MDSDFLWPGQNSSTSFIVPDSQEESEFSQTNLYNNLTALTPANALTTEQQIDKQSETGLNPCNTDVMPATKKLPRRVVNGSGVDPGDNVGNPGDNVQQPSDSSGSTGSGSGVGQAGQGGGAGAGGDGGDGNSGGSSGHQEPDEEEEDEQHMEPTPPSTTTSNSSGSSVPDLVRPAASAVTPPRRYPLPGEEGSPAHGSEDMPGIAGMPPQQPIELSESEGGISDAPTAIVSDTEGHGQVIGQRASLQSPDAPSQSLPSLESTHDPVALSSAVSTMSSLSSSGDSTEPPRSLRKRPPGRKLQSETKRPRDDHSTSSTSESRSATSTSGTTPSKTSDTSTDKTMDTSGERSHETSGDPEDADVAGSQDLFGEEPEESSQHGGRGEDASQSGYNAPGSSQTKSGNDGQERHVSTPSETIGSLQLSGQPMLGQDTYDDSQSLSLIPPSLDVFDSAPRLVPSSPTPLERMTSYVAQFAGTTDGQRHSPRKKRVQDPAENWMNKKPTQPAPRNRPPPHLSDSGVSLPANQTRSSSSSVSSGFGGPGSEIGQEWQHYAWSLESAQRSKSESPSVSGTKSPGPESSQMEESQIANSVQLLKRMAGETPGSAESQSSRSSRSRGNIHSPKHKQGIAEIAERLSVDRRLGSSGPQEGSQGRGLHSGGSQSGSQAQEVAGGSQEAEIGTQDLNLRFSPSQSESQHLALAAVSQSQSSQPGQPEASEVDQLNVSESQPQSSKPTKLQKSPTNNINSDSTENSKSSGSPQEYHLSLPKEGNLLKPTRVMTPPPKLKPIQQETMSDDAAKTLHDDNDHISDAKRFGGPPQLTLDMIVSQSQDTEPVGFTLDRPVVDSQLEADSEKNSAPVLPKARETRHAKEQKEMASTNSNKHSTGDPYEFSETQEYKNAVRSPLKQQGPLSPKHKPDTTNSSPHNPVPQTAPKSKGKTRGGRGKKKPLGTGVDELILRGSDMLDTAGGRPTAPTQTGVSPLRASNTESNPVRGAGNLQRDTPAGPSEAHSIPEGSQMDQSSIIPPTPALPETPASRHSKKTTRARRKPAPPLHSSSSDVEKHPGSYSEKAPEPAPMYRGRRNPGGAQRDRSHPWHSQPGERANPTLEGVTQPEATAYSEGGHVPRPGQEAADRPAPPSQPRMTLEEVYHSMDTSNPAPAQPRKGRQAGQQGHHTQPSGSHYPPGHGVMPHFPAQGHTSQFPAQSHMPYQGPGYPSQYHAQGPVSRYPGMSPGGGQVQGPGSNPGQFHEHGGFGNQYQQAQVPPVQFPSQGSTAQPSAQQARHITPNNSMDLSVPGSQVPRRVTTVKTWMLRTIVLSEERIGTKVLSEKTENLKQEVSHTYDAVSTPSPSRTGQSLSSGDLGDVSSLSRNTSESRQSLISPPSIDRLHSATSISHSSSSGSRDQSHLLGRQQSLNRTSSSGGGSLPQGVNPDQSNLILAGSGHSAVVPTEASHAGQPGQDYPHSEALFSTEPLTDSVTEETKKSRSRSSAGSLRQSASLFSSGSELDRVQSVRGQDKQGNSDSHLFAKPLELPRRRSSSSGRQQASETRQAGPMPPAQSAVINSTETDDLIENSQTIADTAPKQVKPRTASHRGRKRNWGRQRKGGRQVKQKTEMETVGEEAALVTPEEAGTVHPPGEDDISPEIPIVGTVQQSVEKDKHEPEQQEGEEEVFLQPPALPTGPIDTGTPVMALWQDKHYYPGHILTVERNNRYTVAFEDGDTRQVKAADIFLCDLLPRGQEVMVETTEDGWNEVGVVCSQIRGAKDAKFYMVQLENKSVLRAKRGQVILSPTQAFELKTSKQSPEITGNRDMSGSSKKRHSASPSKEGVVGDPNVAADDNSTDVAQEENRVIGVLTISGSGMQQPASSGRKGKRGKGAGDVSAKPVEFGFDLMQKAGETGGTSAPAMTEAVPAEPQTESQLPITSYSPALPRLPCGQLEADTPVLAMWKDRYYYPGLVVTLDSMGKYTVAFDDGDTRHVRETDLIVCDLPPKGSAVMAEREKWSVAGLIVDHYSQGEITGALVEFEDGIQERVPRSKINLTPDQAKVVIHDIRGPVSTPLPGAGDLSLENLIEGKRRRQTPLATTPVSPSEVKLSSTRRRRAAASDVTETSSVASSISTGKRVGKRKMADLEPKAHSTPTPKTKVARVQQQHFQEDADAPSPLESVEASPQLGRRSPRKSKTQLFGTSIKGPIPQGNSRLFQGMLFLLTHVDRSEEQKKQERKMLRQHQDLSTEDTSLEEEDEIPFDKDHLCNQLEAGGGVVLDRYDPERIQGSTSCFLISDMYQRTLKYFYALAAGHPCVSHQWVIDSCRLGQLQDYRSYLLPAGINIETNRLAEWNSSRGSLRGLPVLVSSDNQKFVETWSAVLTVAQCHVLDSLPEPGQADKSLCPSVVIVDQNFPQEVVEQALQLGVPVVQWEWVIQCLITGTRVNTEGDPKYHYMYKPSME